jgi:penicillin amidase
MRARIQRDASGVPHVHARTLSDALWGLGYCHAMDRGMQMLLTRVLGRGEASEHLDSADRMLDVDLFFRRMGWAGGLERELEKLPAETRELLQVYCDGVNARLAEKVPWELKVLGYQPPPWVPGDIIMLMRLISYVSLAQAQTEVEHLLVELVQNGVSRPKLEELFPGLLGGLDEELLRQVKLPSRFVPEEVRWNPAIPKLVASNNWAVAGARTASGMPLLSNDPHLEVNRLPNVWYEVVLTVEEPARYVMGASMPGLPFMLLGRTNDLAWGVTYTYADAVDSWVEHCREGKYRREMAGGEQWLPFRERHEVIRRKGKPDHTVVFHESEHGTLDGDPRQEGYYLATRWAVADAGAAAVLASFRLLNATRVEEGMDLLGRAESSFNWVFADRQGNIGYQMSGRIPRRREGVRGLVPLPGWKPENDWLGFLSHTELPRQLNPEEGFIVTANDDLNRYGQAKPINMPMGDYRARRIAQLLREGSRHTVEDMCRIQYDVYSLQAELFMPLIRPHLPESEPGRILRQWDLRYDPGSRGAYLFEQVYRALYQEVFGKGGLGGACDFLADETGIFIDFYEFFDRVLLSERSEWFDGRPREAIYRAAVEAALEGPIRSWGEVQEVTLSNILFAGKLPRFLGFDRGPVALPGGRATVQQGQIYRSGGRDTSFVPTIRLVTDLSRDEIRTNMVGGPSDRRFSRWYDSDTENWREGRFKTLRPGESPFSAG